VQYQQVCLIDIPAQETVINAYMDSSGDVSSDRWLVFGILLVSQSKQNLIVQSLYEIRAVHDYGGEIHYSELPARFEGQWNAKARIAWDWLKAFGRRYLGACWFQVLAVDTHSLGNYRETFHRDHFAYNRFARMAFDCAIPWFLKSHTKVRLRMFLDNWAERNDPTDNIKMYLPWQTQQSIQKRRQRKPNRYPELTCECPAVAIESDPRQVPRDLRDECELIQLTDTVLGSVANAIRGAAGRPTKVRLSYIVSNWMRDTRRLPWEQKRGLHRLFQVTYFEKGSVYSTGPIQVDPPEQLSFFDVLG
jgi:hypothetical protein